MLPVDATNNVADRVTLDVEICGKIRFSLACLVPQANHLNLKVGEFGMSMRFAFCTSAFLVSVGHVVSHRAEK